ncbi:hypothetical protein [Leptolyngbya sp. BC1307]|uniref:hypothetical protein n=1 Tax=Leptolyngbya sp. BC1307 TaxID=2029589 RepID=UPI000EFA4B43|nr:hypothetical protein [Leptolyngbya sp. BC1307]
MVKKFSRVAAVPKQAVVPQEATEVVRAPQNKVVNLERVDLSDRENWLRALDICKAKTEQPLDALLKEIETYQGQIDQALQTAQAQSTIYAYAIGTRLDVIEENRLFEEKGYVNLTAFIKNGEVKRPNGQSITTRQVWAYRRVTRGLNEFLQLAEEIRDGKPVSPELREQLQLLGARVNQDVVDVFLKSYTESIAGVLELGVSKLEQVYRLPKSMALSGLLAGRLALEENVVEFRDVPFSVLRKAISSHEKKNKPILTQKKVQNTERELDQIEKIFQALKDKELTKEQTERLSQLSKVLDALIS